MSEFDIVFECLINNGYSELESIIIISKLIDNALELINHKQI